MWCVGKYASGRDYVSQGLCNPGILVPKKNKKAEAAKPSTSYDSFKGISF
jgi:hypothetical protein